MIDLTGTRVLVADDDDQSAEITRRFLTRAGCSTDRADDVRDALARLGISKPPFACVVVDFDDGTGQGLELLEAIRGADDHIGSTPVVFCSDVDVNRRFSWESGTDAFLVRPFHIDDLLVAVRDTVARSADDRVRVRREQADLAGA